MTKKQNKAFLEKIKTIGISTGAKKPAPKQGYTIVPVAVHMMPCPVCFSDHSRPDEQSFSA